MEEDQKNKLFWINYTISRDEIIWSFETYGYEETIQMIADKIKHKFPYIRYSMTPESVLQKFNNIINYKPEWYSKNFRLSDTSDVCIRSTFSGKRPIKYVPYIEGTPTSKKHGLPERLVLVNRSGDYTKYNLFLDYFAEHIRIKARRSNQLESTATWYRNHIKEIIEKCIKTYGQISMPLIRETLYRSYYECTEFRVTHICGFIDLWKSKRILDFSAGRGARLIGAISRKDTIDEYVGIDPDPEVHLAYKEILKFTLGENSDDLKKFRMIQGPFEDVPINQIDPTSEKFDLVFTSPPYFDLEIYTNHLDQSIEKYPTLSEWLEGFLYPAITKAWELLKPNGYMAIAINDPAPAEMENGLKPNNKYLSSFLQKCASFVDSDWLGVIGYAGLDNEKLTSVQPVWVFQKNDIKN